MRYEINVSHDRTGHVFATHKRSIRDKDKAITVFRILKNKFPAEDGFTVRISMKQELGSDCTKEFLNLQSII